MTYSITIEQTQGETQPVHVAGYNSAVIHQTVTQCRPVWRGTSNVITLIYHKSSPNVTWSGLSSKSNGFFHGPCATIPPDFVKIGWLVFCVNQLTNKQTKWKHNLLDGGKYLPLRTTGLHFHCTPLRTAKDTYVIFFLLLFSTTESAARYASLRQEIWGKAYLYPFCYVMSNNRRCGDVVTGPQRIINPYST